MATTIPSEIRIAVVDIARQQKREDGVVNVTRVVDALKKKHKRDMHVSTASAILKANGIEIQRRGRPPVDLKVPKVRRK